MKAKMILALVLLFIFVSVALGHAKLPEKKKTEAGKESGKTTVQEVLINRGCPACHMKISDDQNYSLAHEAKEQEADHPTKSPSNVILDDSVTVETCLECHGAAENGKGVNASYALRDIVHPAHLFSPIFKDDLNGTCFSCHNIGVDGKFALLTQKVEGNKKGVPKEVPVTGAQQIENRAAKNVSLNTFIIVIVALGLSNIVTLGIAWSNRK
ncbi:MAG: hypothetical protein E3J54_00065 [Actinobacteria bacterium]|nr:MAG: hypothetical protein E3J54_00065 [Actinomycetota bacterium]